MKKASSEAFLFKHPGLLRLDICSLFALRAGGNVKAHPLVFRERLETCRIDGREMREQVFRAIVRGDETETFCVIEPLHNTCCHADLSKIIKVLASSGRAGVP